MDVSVFIILRTLGIIANVASRGSRKSFLCRDIIDKFKYYPVFCIICPSDNIVSDIIKLSARSIWLLNISENISETKVRKSYNSLSQKDKRKMKLLTKL